MAKRIGRRFRVVRLFCVRFFLFRASQIGNPYHFGEHRFGGANQVDDKALALPSLTRDEACLVDGQRRTAVKDDT